MAYLADILLYLQSYSFEQLAFPDGTAFKLVHVLISVFRGGVAVSTGAKAPGPNSLLAFQPPVNSLYSF